MKYGLLCCFLLFSSWGWSQGSWSWRSQPRWSWRMDELSGQIARLESDPALQQKESLYAVYLTLIEKFKQMQVDEETFRQVSQKMYAEARLIQAIIERNEVTSIAQKDSLIDVFQHLYCRAGEVEYYMRFFPDKRDTFNTVLAKIDKHQPGLDRAITALIEMVSDTNSYSLITVNGLFKLGESHHPAAITFLMDNLMNFAGTRDPTEFGRDPSFYVWPENYPCYTYLMEYSNSGYNNGWHLLPHFEKALEKQLIPEKCINLYATLLDSITQGCHPCRDALLVHYLNEPEDPIGKKKKEASALQNKRANVLQIMKYYTDPVDYYKDLGKPKKSKD